MRINEAPGSCQVALASAPGCALLQSNAQISRPSHCSTRSFTSHQARWQLKARLRLLAMVRMPVEAKGAHMHKLLHAQNALLAVGKPKATEDATSGMLQSKPSSTTLSAPHGPAPYGSHNPAPHDHIPHPLALGLYTAQQRPTPHDPTLATRQTALPKAGAAWVNSGITSRLFKLSAPSMGFDFDSRFELSSKDGLYLTSRNAYHLQKAAGTQNFRRLQRAITQQMQAPKRAIGTWTWRV